MGGYLMHVTARTGYVERRLMLWLLSLSLTGSPAVSHADEGSRAAEDGPWVRVTFDDLEARYLGGFSNTLSVYSQGVLVVCDVFWPHKDATAATGIQPHRTVADELRDAFQDLVLDFTDYTVPAAPVTVADAPIMVDRVRVRRIDDDAGFRRLRVEATARWNARSDNRFA